LNSNFDSIVQPKNVVKYSLPKVPFRILVCGPSSSGKSTVIVNMLNEYKDYFDDIYIIGPSALQDPIWSENLELKVPKKNYITQPTAQNIENIFKKGLESVKKLGHKDCKKTLVVLEDVAGTVLSGVKSIKKPKLLNCPQLFQMYSVGRHAELSIITICQSYVILPRSSRLQCSHCICLPAKDSELSKIAQEWCPPSWTEKKTKKLLETAIQPTQQSKHNFIYIDCFEQDPNKKFRQNFDKYIIYPSSSSSSSSFDGRAGDVERSLADKHTGP
jgi:AAA+ ATPase superfamily predicted ATPase